jgi:hypothetical protein
MYPPITPTPAPMAAPAPACDLWVLPISPPIAAPPSPPASAPVCALVSQPIEENPIAPARTATAAIFIRFIFTAPLIS